MLLFWKNQKKGRQKGKKNSKHNECKGELHLQYVGNGTILDGIEFEHNINGCMSLCFECAHILTIEKSMKSSARKRIENGRFCGYEPGLAKKIWQKKIIPNEWRCDYSDIKMQPRGDKNLKTVSIDRINPLGSYEFTNIACTLLEINLFKGKYIDPLIIKKGLLPTAKYLSSLAKQIEDEGDSFAIKEKENKNLESSLKSDFINKDEFGIRRTVQILKRMAQLLINCNQESCLAIKAQRYVWSLEKHTKELERLLESLPTTTLNSFATKEDIKIIEQSLIDYSKIQEELTQSLEKMSLVAEVSEELIEMELEYEQHINEQLELEAELEEEIIRMEKEYQLEEERNLQIEIEKALEEVSMDIQNGFS